MKITHNFDVSEHWEWAELVFDNSGEWEDIVSFDEDNLFNPKTEFFNEQWYYSELLFHVILDKLWAFWLELPLDWQDSYKFVGKVLGYKNSHIDDLSLLKSLSNWDIPLKTLL